MINISLAYPYELAAAFHRLRVSLQQERTLSDVWYDLYEVENQLIGLLSPGSLYFEALRGTVPPGNVLYEAIKKLTTETDRSRQLDLIDVFSVRNSLDHFETVLKAELAVAATYFVSKKGGFDTLDLILKGEALFPADLGQKVPTALEDVREAGRCLAFELGTAAGFHLLRANEAVLLAYWDAVTGKSARPRNRNLGTYIKQLNILGVGNAKVLAVLQQIKDLHRNSLVHPEDILTVEQAIALFGIIRSAMGAMLVAIPFPD